MLPLAAAVCNAGYIVCDGLCMRHSGSALRDTSAIVATSIAWTWSNEPVDHRAPGAVALAMPGTMAIRMA